VDWWGRTPLYMAVDMNTLPRRRPDRASTDKPPRCNWYRRSRPRREPERAAQDPASVASGADRGCDAMLVTGATPLLRAAKTFDTDSMKL
jgi:hypothetical protein